jgi:glycine cleavage system H protein
MDFPKELKFTANDEWVRVEGNTGKIGISDYAQDQLSDIVYLEVTLENGEDGKKGDIFGTVESVKAASDMYLPVGGKVIEINDGLMDTPEMINSDPYVNGWIIKIEIADDSDLEDLMDAASYEANTKERG